MLQVPVLVLVVAVLLRNDVALDIRQAWQQQIGSVCLIATTAISRIDLLVELLQVGQHLLNLPVDALNDPLHHFSALPQTHAPMLLFVLLPDQIDSHRNSLKARIQLDQLLQVLKSNKKEKEF